MDFRRLLLTILFVAVMAGVSLHGEEDAAPELIQGEVIEPDSAESSPASPPYVLETEDGVVDVYIIPIQGPISRPNLFILRRALKEAIANDVEMVILDMDTPGGRVDVCLEMMEMLDRFEGLTATYVNVDAISAGSLLLRLLRKSILRPGHDWGFCGHSGHRRGCSGNGSLKDGELLTGEDTCNQPGG